MKFVPQMIRVFLYWIEERHSIYLKKEAGKKWPWTSDKILQEYKFTNPFRQNDRVTKELGIRLAKLKGARDLLWHIVVFRLFNEPQTYDTLNNAGLLKKWNEEVAIELLEASRNLGVKIFTGAYMMTGSGSSGPGGKIKLACGVLTKIWKDLDDIYEDIVHNAHTLEESTTVLSQYPMIGDFVAYEMVCDMRHTVLLNYASDIYTWANPGPGAKRGIHRLLWNMPDKPAGLTMNNGPVGKVDYQQAMRELLQVVRSELGRKKLFKQVEFEMRDVEHSLCEFDKYMRVKNGEGRPRSKYNVQDKS